MRDVSSHTRRAGLRGRNAQAGLRDPNALVGLRGPNALVGPGRPVPAPPERRGASLWQWVRIALAVGAVVCLVLAFATPAHQSGSPTVGDVAVVNATDPDRPLVRSNEAPSVLVDRKDGRTVYLSQVELASGECRFYISLNRGVTWTREQTPRLHPFTQNCALGTGQPQNIRTELQQAPDGTLYWIFSGNDPGAGGSRSVLLGRSTDGGRSWRTVVVAAGAPASTPEEAELNFQAHVAVDEDHPERVYVMWRRTHPPLDPGGPFRPSRPFMAASTDGGATFSAPTQLFDVALGTDGPRPLVVGDRLYAFYQEARPPLPVNDPNPSPTPPQARLFAAVSRDRGRTWTRSEIAAARDLSEDVPAYDAKREQLYVVWHDNRRDELDVYFASSKDGTAWSEPKLLNDDQRGTRVGQHFPQISVSRMGRIDVAWYDWRDDPFPAPAVGGGNVLSTFGNRGKLAGVYLTSSSDGGRTWLRNVKVNDVPIDRTIGTWANNYDVLAPPALTSFATGAVVGWSDTRLGTAQSQSQDIVTSTVMFGTVRDARVTGLQAALVGGVFGAGLSVWATVLVMRRHGRAETRPEGRLRT